MVGRGEVATAPPPRTAPPDREATSSSQLSTTTVVNKRAVEQRRQRTRQLWGLLRSTITDTVNATLENDAKERRVAHGVHHLREIVHRNKIHQAFADQSSGCYYTVDDAAVRIFGADGRKLDVLMPQEKINRLCLAYKLDLFVGWLHKEEKLCLFNKDFDLLSSCIAPGRLYNVVYNEARNEIVACGAGFLQTYMFRFGNRHLVAKSFRLDSDVIADWNVALVAIENTMSHTQRCFVAHENMVAVFNLNSAEHIVTKKDLHVRDISAILFFNPLKLLLTASMDGCIKVWNEAWFLHFVFVGHTAGVTCLSAYPSGPVVVSGGLDRTIRVWSLEILDEIDRQTVKEPVLGMNTVIGNKQFCSFGENDLHIWIIQDIHSLHSFIGCPVVKIKCTDHPNFPTRAMCLCKDSSIRIVAPSSGAILTTLLLDPQLHKAVDAAYAIAEETLFVALEGGDILKCKTDTNPARIIAQWKCTDPKYACNYLMVYEYVVSSQKGVSWKSIARAFNTGHLEHATVSTGGDDDDVDGTTGSSNSSSVEPGSELDEEAKAAAAAAAAAAAQANRKADRTLLLGGRKDGYLCVVNWDTGATDFDIEAHGVKGVLSMIANSADDQVVSAGRDDVIKVWRLFPYAKEALAPLISFFCAQTPLHMTVLRGKLGVAFDEHSTATYSIVVYNLTNKERRDHSPEDDHTDSITALTCCHRMKLFASSSLDGTIKVWSDTNKLIRHVKLNATPVSLAFYDDRGSLLVGIGKNLFRIDAHHYLPRAFLYKQVTMTFPAINSEQPLPYDENTMASLSADDVKRLHKAKAAYKYEHYDDELSEEESAALNKANAELHDKYEVLIRREEEIAKLRDGDIKPTVKLVGSPSTKQSAFLRYLAIFYDRPSVRIYAEDRFPEDTLQRKLNPPKYADDDRKKQLDEETQGFFPPKAHCKTLTLTELLQESGYNVEEDKPLLGSVDAATKRSHAHYPYGYLPNSVLLRLLFKAEELQEKQAEAWQAPSFSDRQLLELEKARKKAKSDSEERLLERENTDELSRIFTWSDDEQDTTDAAAAAPTDAAAVAGAEQASKQKPKKPRGRVSFMQEDAAPNATTAGGATAAGAPGERQVSFAERMKNLIEKPRTPPPPKTPEQEEAKAAIKAPDKPSRPVQKLVSRPPPPKVKPKTPPPPPREPTPTPPPPPPPASPLPQFVTRFFGENWFERLLPNVTPKTFPKPWTIEAFISMLCKALVAATYADKPSVANAIDSLNDDEDFKNKDVVTRACFEVLNPAAGLDPPTCLEPNQKLTVKAVVTLLGRFQLTTLDYYTELMCQFIDGDREMRSLVMDLFLVSGLVDPNHYFPNELDSLDTWSVEATSRKKAVKNICSGWLEGWMTRFKSHIKHTIDLLQSGKNVQSKLGGGSSAAGGSRHAARDSSEPKARALTVTIKEPPSLSVLEHAMYIEAINYFCEMEHQKEMSKLAIKETPDEMIVEAKNTVLVLPKLRIRPTLVRLGELHTNSTQCREYRETNLAVAHLRARKGYGEWSLPPGAVDGFVPFIKHPLKTLYVNPFPSIVDKYDPWQQQPVLITLRTSPKYFLHEQSVVPPTLAVSTS